MQACLLTQETVNLCAAKTEQPVSDIQAMYEDYRSRDMPAYIIFDWTVPGGYAPWIAMSKTVFDRQLRFVFDPPSNKKFEPIVSI